MADRNRHPYVYLAVGQWGHKIGISHNPRWRMGAIRATLICSWHRPIDSGRVEKAAHALLAEHLSHGQEWFAVSRADAMSAVRKAMKVAATERRKLQAAEQRALVRQAKRDAEYAAAWKLAVEAADAVAAEIGWP